MKALYRSEISQELAKYCIGGGEIITEQDLAPLPLPVQRFFRHCGYLGREKMQNAEIKWANVDFKMSPKKNWMKLDCQQFNSVPEPMRIALMKAKLLGILPIAGRDIYQNGHGNMRFKLFNKLQVADAKGKEIDVSALVTVLAETFLVPTYALQPYISWSSIDDHTAYARIKWQKTEAGGIFYFNDDGEFIRFETEDRYYTEKGNKYRKMKWFCVAKNYIERAGIKFPSYLSSSWKTATGDYEYFKGRIIDIKFNLNKE